MTGRRHTNATAFTSAAQVHNAAIHERFMKGEFRVLCSDGRVVGSQNKETPISKSIMSRRKSPAERAKKQVRRAANQQARADIYRTMAQSSSKNDFPAELAQLRAISLGTA